MAYTSRTGGRERSPERTKIWTAPKLKSATQTEVAVIYYLSRNGFLQQPHFLQIPLSSSNALHLKDFIHRLNSLRGRGFASHYSWSSKRSYKYGFVWQDLFEEDFIHPINRQEYVLKGSELLEPSPSFRCQEAESSGSKPPIEMIKSINGSDLACEAGRRDAPPWESTGLHEYKVYKAESAAEIVAASTDASTQTDDGSPRGRFAEENPTTELSRGEISPPPSSASSETFDSRIKDEGCSMNGSICSVVDRTSRDCPSGRVRASAVLMQVISCGSMLALEEHDFSSMSNRGPLNQVVSKDKEIKEGFSGCLTRRKKANVEESLALKGSSFSTSSSR